MQEKGAGYRILSGGGKDQDPHRRGRLGSSEKGRWSMLSNTDNMQSLILIMIMLSLIMGADEFDGGTRNWAKHDQAAATVRSQTQADAILSAHVPLAVLPPIAVRRPQTPLTARRCSPKARSSARVQRSGEGAAVAVLGRTSAGCSRQIRCLPLRRQCHRLPEQRRRQRRA